MTAHHGHDVAAITRLRLDLCSLLPRRSIASRANRETDDRVKAPRCGVAASRSMIATLLARSDRPHPDDDQHDRDTEEEVSVVSTRVSGTMPKWR
jgi:hypothetical protein